MLQGMKDLRWMLLMIGAAVTLPGCESMTEVPVEPDIATMRLTVGGTQTVNVTEASAPGAGCVASQPITIPRNVTTTISASFLNAAGSPDPIANDPAIFRLSGDDTPDNGAEPSPTPSTITWTRTGNFAGTLRGTVTTTSGSVALSAFHIGDAREDFGPCEVQIVVSP